MRTKVLLAAIFATNLGLLACQERSYNSETLDQTLGEPLKFKEYKILFTNPSCKEYVYPPDWNMKAVDGTPLKAKPKDVYCKQSDGPASGNRPESPKNQLLQWINDPETKEIFFTYLSFSNSDVTNALCTAVKERGLKLKFVLDKESDTTKADILTECVGPNGEKPEFALRGHTPGIGYAHNKIFMVNPGAPEMKISFSSGNMSSGTVLHHENWHFITLPSDTFFAQVHLCVRDAEWNSGDSGANFGKALNACRKAIKQKPESDISAYFSPTDGKKASAELVSGIENAEKISVAAHRFSYTVMLKALGEVASQKKLRIITDDDLYWVGTADTEVGDNTIREFFNVKNLVKRGATARYFETNHGEHLLHHNKYLIFHNSDPTKRVLFVGAGNLTGTAFTENWENFYVIKIPHIIDAFEKQYDKMWTTMATPPEKMPKENRLP